MVTTNNDAVVQLFGEVDENTKLINPTQFNYTLISQSDREKTRSLVEEVKYELRKTGEQIVRVGFVINELYKISGKYFNELCAAEFPDFTEKTLRKYRGSYLFAQEYQLTNLHLINPRSIYQLMSSTMPYRDEVIDEIKDRLTNQTQVTGEDIKHIISKLDNDNNEKLHEEIDTIKSELLEANSQIRKISESKKEDELTILKLNEKVRRLVHNEDSSNNEILNLTEEINNLSKEKNSLENMLKDKERNPAVVTETVEVPPKGYLSIQDAIDSANEQLRTKTEQLKVAEETLRNSKREILELEHTKSAIKQNSEAINEFYNSITNVIEAYPVAMIEVIVSSENSESKKVLTKIVANLRLMSDVIEKALNQK